MMRRTPLQRKTKLSPKAAKPKGKKAWIPKRQRVDVSRMDCCPEAKARVAALVAMGCFCCGSPPEIHHLRKGTAKSGRAPWWRTIPLCPTHHDEGGPGVAVHGGTRVWAWQEEDVLARVNARLPEQLCGPHALE